MSCLRCGKETPVSQAFCNDCLQDMSHYPVRSDAPIHLPKRNEKTVSKKAVKRKKLIKPEDQVIHLRKIIRWMMVLLVLSSLLTCIAVAKLVAKEENPKYPDGKNYITTTEQD